MKITVFGSKGMAGHMIVAYLRQQGHTITALDRSHVDIENPQEVRAILRTIDADFVINCIGLLVQPSIDRPDRAILVNSWFPHYLEQYFKNTQTRIIHLSTDCVFDGSQGYYVENDIHTETNAYGRSKSLGEINNNKDVTFRMSIIGPGGGLLEWCLTSTELQLNGWIDSWWNGITTLQLAKCINQYINNPVVNGIVHLVENKNSINKYELLCKINHVYNLNKTIVAVEGSKPANKILLDTQKLVDWGIPDYDTQLHELRSFDPLAHVSPTPA